MQGEDAFDIFFRDKNYDDLCKGLPETGDTLFKGSYSANPEEYLLSNSFDIYYNSLIEGYKEAVRVLSENMLNDSDAWTKYGKIYPILYIFRHYLEITMKENLRLFRILHDEISYNQVGYVKGHNLKNIWKGKELDGSKGLKEYISKVFSGNEEIDNAVEKIINEINEVDKDSFVFRYGVPQSLDNFSVKLRCIDLIKFLYFF